MILPPTYENLVCLGDDSDQCTVALVTPRRVTDLLVEAEERFASYSNVPLLEPKSQEVKALLEAAHRSLRLRQGQFVPTENRPSYGQDRLSLFSATAQDQHIIGVPHVLITRVLEGEVKWRQIDIRKEG
jgi:predicted TIM-barrel fold metal-dependent hydrolase